MAHGYLMSNRRGLLHSFIINIDTNLMTRPQLLSKVEDQEVRLKRWKADFDEMESELIKADTKIMKLEKENKKLQGRLKYYRDQPFSMENPL
jgi:septal ring factor EnvC (AmiA/AmiB activator)